MHITQKYFQTSAGFCKNAYLDSLCSLMPAALHIKVHCRFFLLSFLTEAGIADVKSAGSEFCFCRRTEL